MSPWRGRGSGVHLSISRPKGESAKTTLNSQGSCPPNQGNYELKPNLLAFSDDFYKFQILRLVGFYNFISADEVCLLLYPRLLLKEGIGLVSFVLIGKAVRLIQSINCITVYCNEFFLAFGAGYRVELAMFHSISSIIEKDGIVFFV